MQKPVTYNPCFLLSKYIENKYGGNIPETLDHFKKRTCQWYTSNKDIRNYELEMHKSQDNAIHPSGKAAYALHLSQQIGISEKINEAMISNIYHQGSIQL